MDMRSTSNMTTSDTPASARTKAGRARRTFSLLRTFDRFATTVTLWTGSPVAFGLAISAVLAWAVTGPAFEYSETWQLVINTGTTIVTFLMVFLIQQSQNKDSRAVHLKLNELLATQKNASNKLVDIEELDEEQLRKLAVYYRRLAERANRPAAGTAGQSKAREHGA